MGDARHPADELENRLIDFAVRIVALADALPNTAAGRHIANQILRCGTSPAPNYAEGRVAESKADFTHKLKIALKELNETRVWLKMTIRADLMPSARLTELIDECEQLCRILNSSLATTKSGKKRQPLQ